MTFDDGVISQFRRAAPILNDHGLRTTFYLNPSSKDWQQRLAPWQKVAEVACAVLDWRQS